jgi:hypothetical protein
MADDRIWPKCKILTTLVAMLYSYFSGTLSFGLELFTQASTVKQGHSSSTTEVTNCSHESRTTRLGRAQSQPDRTTLPHYVAPGPEASSPCSQQPATGP